MPEMDGFEVFSALKKNYDTRDIPIIFMTGLCNESDEVKGLAFGAVDYINKPFNRAIVELSVENQLKIKKRMRENGGNGVV